MKSSPYFSIVIPAHNESASIEQTLNAVLKQEYPHFEVIVVDNLSTDNTIALVESIAATDIRVHVVQCPIKGVLHARDAGYRAAKGDIIVQLDANAFPLDKEWLFRAVRHFDNNNVVAIAGSYYFYDAKVSFRIMSAFTMRFIFPLLNWFVQKTHRGGLLIGGNCFIRKSALDTINGYPVDATEFWFDDLITGCAVAPYGWIVTPYTIRVAKSARRYIKHGYRKTQHDYNKGTLAVLLRKPFPSMEKATDLR